MRIFDATLVYASSAIVAARISLDLIAVVTEFSTLNHTVAAHRRNAETALTHARGALVIVETLHALSVHAEVVRALCIIGAARALAIRTLLARWTLGILGAPAGAADALLATRALRIIGALFAQPAHAAVGGAMRVIHTFVADSIDA